MFAGGLHSISTCPLHLPIRKRPPEQANYSRGLSSGEPWPRTFASSEERACFRQLIGRKAINCVSLGLFVLGGTRSHGGFHGATGMSAITGQLSRISRVLTVLAAIFTAVRRQASAGWMRTLSCLWHSSLLVIYTPLVQIANSGGAPRSQCGPTPQTSRFSIARPKAGVPSDAVRFFTQRSDRFAAPVRIGPKRRPVSLRGMQLLPFERADVELRLVLHPRSPDAAESDSESLSRRLTESDPLRKGTTSIEKRGDM